VDTGGIAVSPPAQAHQIYPMSASNGRNHLVLWLDGMQLRAARVRGEDGAVLDSPPLTLPAAPGAWRHDTPRYRVATDGTDYLVLYSEGGGSGGPIDLLSLRIRAEDGRLLDATPRRVTAAVEWLGWVGLAHVQSHYVAAWTVYHAPTNLMTLFARRLQPDGVPVDPVVTVREDRPAYLSRTRVVQLPDAALVMWHDLSGLRGRRLRISDATPLDAEPLPLMNVGQAEAATMAAAFDGEHVLLVGKQIPVYDTTRLVRLDTQGAVVGLGGVEITPGGGYPETEFALSPSSRGRSLLVSTRFDPAVGTVAHRLRFRMLGAMPPPPPQVDAGIDTPPAPVDAPGTGDPPVAVDAPVVADATAPGPDAMLVADAEADAPGPFDGGAGDAPAPDAPAPEGDAPSADSATAEPARDAGDVPRDSADASRDGDAGAPSDDEPACGCDLGGRSDGRGAARWLIPLIAIVWWRRREKYSS
jgi:hypothetical protein